MAKVVNNFIKGKMNKDLDDRLIPNGEYRNAVNTQVSKSEGQNVGALENVLGTLKVGDFRDLAGEDDLFSIGYFADEINNRVFVFLTNNLTSSYDPSNANFIYVYNALDGVSTKLVEGAFLNFSTLFPITGVNLLEELLFFTDNRNQPRKINVSLALTNGSSYYSNEDQISVAKYNPYKTIDLYRRSADLTDPTPLGKHAYETSMYDVVSKAYPDGGVGFLDLAYTGGATSFRITKSSFTGDFKDGLTIAYIDNGVFVKTSATISSVVNAANYWTINTTGTISASNLPNNTEIIFSYNDYFDINYNGDKDFLKDKFARFSYRFKFVDGEYSIFAPFTQECFIPRQDGYFMYKINPSVGGTLTNTRPPLDVEDEEEAYRSTIVDFMENKVNKIILRIPLPLNSTQMQSDLKVEEIDILYKESDGLVVNVIETIPITRVQQQTATAVTASPVSGTTAVLNNIVGGIKIGALVSGLGITNSPTVVAFDGVSTVTLSSSQTILAGTNLTFGDSSVFEYEYQSTKPYKVLPSDELTRTYDKVPVKALAQEIISNRVVYGNYQDKHTPPNTIDYNVAVSKKSDFNLGVGGAEVQSLAASGQPDIVITNLSGVYENGAVVTANAAGIPAGTVISSISGSTLTLSQNLTNALAAGVILTFTAPSSVRYNTSIIEYPNSSLKQKRNYQVGVVLSDRYGRQSTVVLSDTSSSVTFNNEQYLGSTVFSDYITSEVTALDWPGNSLKMIFNTPISGAATGLYNGDPTSSDYNPLGWYSYKIVVKQTEQEYYNVYLPGVMAAYPEDPTKELGKTSHTVLINDNINKVPRDLTEVGPEQKLFRSSIILHGRVENLNSSVVDENNIQYYPGILSPTVSVIATDNDLFNGNDVRDFVPAAEFYSVASNPLIARITTPSKQYGIPAVLTTAEITANSPANRITVANSSPDATASNCIRPGMTITGPGVPPGTTITTIVSATTFELSQDITATITPATTYTFSPTQLTAGGLPGGTRYINMPQLAVMETDGVDSNLDIFWETTTTGLISELNQAILGGTADSVSIDSFNASLFTEDLAVNNNILSANFKILDQFGNSVNYQATTPPQVQLEKVEDFNNPPNDVTSKFELVNAVTTPGLPGQYNIKLLDAMYYSYQHETKDTFNFIFKVNYPNGVETLLSQSPVALINKPPKIFGGSPIAQITCGTAASNETWIPGDAGNPADGTFKTLQGQNGAIGLTGLANKDLTWSITVVKDGVDYGPAGENYVKIDQSAVNIYWQGKFYFNGGNPPNDMADGAYACTATIQDAGGSTCTTTFTLNIDRTPCYTFTYVSTNDGTNLGSFTITDCDGDPTASTPNIINNGNLYSICARSMSAAGLVYFTQQPLNSPLSVCNN